LVEDRPLAIGNIVWSPARTGAPIRVMPRVNVPLNLDDAAAIIVVPEPLNGS
jgi:hypothetical protein